MASRGIKTRAQRKATEEQKAHADDSDNASEDELPVKRENKTQKGKSVTCKHIEPVVVRTLLMSEDDNAWLTKRDQVWQRLIDRPKSEDTLNLEYMVQTRHGDNCITQLTKDPDAVLVVADTSDGVLGHLQGRSKKKSDKVRARTTGMHGFAFCTNLVWEENKRVQRAFELEFVTAFVPNCRVGTAVVTAAIAVAKARRLKRVVVYSIKSAEAFYKALGFTPFRSEAPVKDREGRWLELSVT